VVEKLRGSWFGISGARSCKKAKLAQLQLAMGFRIVILVMATAALISRIPAVDAARSLRSFDVPAFFALGDSLADVGTNDYLPKATFKADFPPYGKTFFGRPTGRFSNGRVVVDFLGKCALSSDDVLRELISEFCQGER